MLYDAAHTFGIRKNGHCLALEGDASIYSFHATKLFNTIEGGAIVFKDGTLRTKFNQYKNFGIESEDSIPNIGGNGKMCIRDRLKPLAPSLMRYQKQYFETFDYRSILMQNVVTGGAMAINRALACLLYTSWALKLSSA